jgi:hypothetical protein
MLNKLKFIGIIFLSILLLTNCKKEDKQDKDRQGELVFAPIDITPDKSGWDWQCDLDLNAVYAMVIIDGEEHYPYTYVLDGKLYTQTIKLDAGNHVIEYFALMDDMGTPEIKYDDGIVKATPLDGSEFAQYVEYTLPKPITIVAFQKFELKIDVLCYIPEIYEYFGFFWFDVNEITVREQCFFGDFCLPNLADYEGSLYAQNGLFVDEVAIFMIKAFRNDEMLGEFYNTYEVEEELLFKEPLCIKYPDYDNAEDYFKFELWIYVKVGEDFEYVLFHIWEFMNDEKIENGGDGVVEFVLGDCVYTETDLLLPPYINQYFTGTSTWVEDIYLGDTTYLPSGQILIENQTSEWYDDATDWRVTGSTFWTINWLIEPDPPFTAEVYGTTELFVDGDRGKWEMSWQGPMVPTAEGFLIEVHAVATGVEGEVMGLFAEWNYTMNFDFSNPNFMYISEGYINSQYEFME